MRSAIPYITLFVVTELIISSILYFIHSIAFRNSYLEDAIRITGAHAFSRLVTLQILICLALFAISAVFGLHKKYMVILILYIVSIYTAFSLTWASYSDAWQIFKFPSSNVLGEGFAMILSVTLTYLIFLTLGMQKD